MRPTLIAALSACVPCAAFAALPHVRLVNSSNGNALFWQTPSNVSIVISSTGSDNIADTSELAAIRNAIDAWNDATGTTAQLVENTDPVQQARTDWPNDNIHLVLFDEVNTSGYFPGGSGIVAITPVEFFSNGRIADADVLFNGSDWQFTTNGQALHFDVQDVGTHEIGHLLGLDHSGWAGATMYPYVNFGIVLQRSLASDDVHGLRHAYPSGAHATITGTVRRFNGNAAVSGAHVTAVDGNGRTAGGTLTDAAGNFQIRGLDAGSYSICADPLDEPVSRFDVFVPQAIETDFQAAIGAPIMVGAGATAAFGDLLVDDDVPLSLGEVIDTLPLRAIAGQTRSFTVHGTDLDVGSTLQASDPALTIAPPTWLGDRVQFQVTAPAGAANGHADLIVANVLGDIDILSAALEITPPSPTVTGLSDALGSVAGGTSITITGTNFNPGARVVLGERVYRDGVAGGCTVASSTSITLTTQATAAGQYDLVVMDASGVEGRAAGAFSFVSFPVVSTAFPLAGSSLGSTEITLTGQSFLAGLVVRINGVQQSQVNLVSATEVVITTDPGVPGGPYVLEVENTGGGMATSAFTYVLQDDPAVASVLPLTGSRSGGEVATISGSGFTANSNVVFGVDPQTGQGGTSASNVTFIDASTLEVVTPAHSNGAVAVMVSEPSGQADVLDAAFTFTGGGGGGGGCSIDLVDEGSARGPGALEGAWWLFAVLLTLAIAARRARAATVPVR